MDTRYRERGYSASFMETDYGAFVTIRRNGEIVGEVGIGIPRGGPDHPVEITISRFVPEELPLTPGDLWK